MLKKILKTAGIILLVSAVITNAYFVVTLSAKLAAGITNLKSQIEEIQGTDNRLLATDKELKGSIDNTAKEISTKTQELKSSIDNTAKDIEVKTQDIKQDLNKYKEEVKKETEITVKGITTNINSLNQKIVQLPAIEKAKKLALELKLRQVNIKIVNKTLEASGSGVTIKYKGKFYILSAGHMAEKDTDVLFLSENGQDICELEIVKHAYAGGALTENSNDLILLRPKDPNIVPRVAYVELESNNEPDISNELYVVGNPLGIEDVVSDGRCIMYRGNFMYMIGTSYFGNSGGGVFNKEGKLVGIMSHLIPIQPFADVPAYMIHGAVRLNTIIEFIEGTNWTNT